MPLKPEAIASYKRAWRANRIERGKCIDCPNESPIYQRCLACRRLRSASAAHRYRERLRRELEAAKVQG